MKEIRILGMTLVMLTALYGCSSTRVVNSWKAPGVQLRQGDFSKVMVAVLSTNETSRRHAEQKLASYNPIFVPSHQVLGTQAVVMDTSKSKAILQRQGFDGVLTFRLLQKDKSTTWVPGSYSYGYSYYGYHSHYYSNFYDPGYVREDVRYYIECNLHSFDKGLVWSGVTSTMNPSDLERTVDEVVYEVYKRMRQDGLFAEENTSKMNN